MQAPAANQSQAIQDLSSRIITAANISTPGPWLQPPQPRLPPLPLLPGTVVPSNLTAGGNLTAASNLTASSNVTSGSNVTAALLAGEPPKILSTPDGQFKYGGPCQTATLYDVHRYLTCTIYWFVLHEKAHGTTLIIPNRKITVKTQAANKPLCTPLNSTLHQMLLCTTHSLSCTARLGAGGGGSFPGGGS